GPDLHPLRLRPVKGRRPMPSRSILAAAAAALAAALAAGCLSSEPEGLYPAEPAATTVKMDFFHRPLPEIPLPNDIATRPDETSPTGIRINASMLAPTGWERTTRELLGR